MNIPELKRVTTLDIAHERDIIDNEKYRNDWNTCCSRTNPHFIKYCVQATVSTAVLIFSMAQLVNKEDNHEVYLPLISFVLGVFFPSPSIPIS